MNSDFYWRWQNDLVEWLLKNAPDPDYAGHLRVCIVALLVLPLLVVLVASMTLLRLCGYAIEWGYKKYQTWASPVPVPHQESANG